jgi:hypothetical protein
MTKVDGINIEITTLSEDAFEERERLTRLLIDRFYISKTVGNQKIFIDIVNEKKDLQLSHIIGVLCHEGMEFSEANKLASQTHFRPIVNEESYKPGMPRVYEENGLFFLNSWRPPLIEPKEGDYAPFKDHLQRALKDDAKVNYYLDMLAWRYQHPLEPKPHIAFYFYGAKGGSGKSTHVETITKVFGESSVKAINTTNKLSDGSAVQLWSRTWLVIEEANIAKGTALYDNIKSFTGSEETDASVKYSHFSKHKVPAQLIMMSNRPPAFIEENDRRFFIAEWTMEGNDEDIASYFKQYRFWLEDGGYEAIAYLLSTRTVSRNVYEPAMVTPEKQQAQTSTLDECVREIKDFIQDKSPAKIFKRNDFFEIFYEHGIKRNQEKHKLIEAGLIVTGRIRIDGKQEYWWIEKGSMILSKQGVPAVYIDQDKIPTAAYKLVFK